MKKLILNTRLSHIAYLLLSLVLLSSCGEIVNSEKHYKTSKLQLRQLIQTTEKVKSSTASYFLIGGSFHSEEHNETTVKVFALVQGRYRLIEMPISEVRIKIDNKIKIPNIVVEYTSDEKYSDENIISDDWEYKVYVINCPEQYLPEKLLPIGF